MKIEIWSDVMCPFCYLGKHRLERALENFPHRDQVAIEWKSFQLHQGMKTEPGRTLTAYLVERKGWSAAQIKQSHDRIARAGAELGLKYDFDRAVVADSFDAHRMIQFAKSRGSGEAMEERLFRAYFEEGLSIADHETLARLAREIGLDEAEARSVLADAKAYATEVRADLREAQQLGVTGVPFFVFDRTFAVSGAQDGSVFTSALEQAYEDADTTP